MAFSEANSLHSLPPQTTQFSFLFFDPRNAKLRGLESAAVFPSTFSISINGSGGGATPLVDHLPPAISRTMPLPQPQTSELGLFHELPRIQELLPVANTDPMLFPLPPSLSPSASASATLPEIPPQELTDPPLNHISKSLDKLSSEMQQLQSRQIQLSEQFATAFTSTSRPDGSMMSSSRKAFPMSHLIRIESEKQFPSPPMVADIAHASIRKGTPRMSSTGATATLRLMFENIDSSDKSTDSTPTAVRNLLDLNGNSSNSNMNDEDHDINSPSWGRPLDIPSSLTRKLMEPSNSMAVRAVSPNSGNSVVETLLLKKYLSQIKETCVTRWQDIVDLHLDPQQFPYYVSPDMKSQLMHAGYLFLHRPDYVKFVSQLPTGNRCQLLVGPTNSEIYQEQLVRALAHQYQAYFISFDMASFIPTEKDQSKRSEDHVRIASIFSQPATTTPKRRFHKGDRVVIATAPQTNPQIYSFPGINSLNFNGSRSDDIINSRNHRRIDSTRPLSNPSIYKLANGLKGQVVWAAEDNPLRVGVRFDTPIIGGGDLSGRCEDGYGSFVAAADLRLEEEDTSTMEKMLIKALFETVDHHRPCVLFIKDVSRTITANVNRLSEFKRSIDRIESPCLVMGSSVVSDKKRLHNSSISDLSSGPGAMIFSPRPSRSSDSRFPSLSGFSFWNSLLDHQSSSLQMPLGIGDSPLLFKKSKIVSIIFPNKIMISPPEQANELEQWHVKLNNDGAIIREQLNMHHFRMVMAQNNITCTTLTTELMSSEVFSFEAVENIVGWAVSHHLQNEHAIELVGPPPQLMQVSSTSDSSSSSSSSSSSLMNTGSATNTIASHSGRNDQRLLISGASINHAIKMHRTLAAGDNALQGRTGSSRSLKNISLDNEFEKRLLSEVVPPSEIGVRFDDIGALEKVKNTLRELVMWPLQYPQLFRKGNLTKPCKGILLFGPPGTGKTMLAKAVATECQANFLNISFATVGSKWFGEAEKFVRAVFTLASKLSPSVIFIDEVDSILGKRERHGEHEAMRKLKNEMMSAWDGLQSKDNERVLVLAATNRPQDLDDAVLRRMPRRLLVDLPDAENRVKVIKVILAHEDLDSSVDLQQISLITEGYSCSDLKNLCIAAAYRPIREILYSAQKGADPARHEPATGSTSSSITTISHAIPTPTVRPLRMEDFIKAKEEVSASVSEDAFSISELRKWNSVYGEGGNRSAPSLTYFV